MEGIRAWFRIGVQPLMLLPAIEPCRWPRRGSPVEVLLGHLTESEWSFRHNHLRPPQYKFRLLAGEAVFALFGDAEGVHSFHTLAADTLV